jgi:type III secretion system FlhB-like substrate exporter
MSAQVIQLSDRQQSEPRIEAMVFVQGVGQVARNIRAAARRADLLPEQRLVVIDGMAQNLVRMEEVAYQRIDELTLDFGYEDRRGKGGTAA